MMCKRKWFTDFPHHSGTLDQAIPYFRNLSSGKLLNLVSHRINWFFSSNEKNTNPGKFARMISVQVTTTLIGDLLLSFSRVSSLLIMK